MSKTIFMLTVIVILLVSAFGLYSLSYINEETIEITVKDKYIKRNSDDDMYLVVDENNDTYKITDLSFIGKWNSTDLYNQLDIGKKYRITVTGIRNHFLSEYKNINKVEEIK